MALGDFVSKVLEKTLQKTRYESDHLKTVFLGNEELKSKWMAGSQLALEEILTSKKETGKLIRKAEEFKKFLITKLITDQHLKPVPEYLLAYLKDEISLKEALEKVDKKDHFQKGCLMLCDTSIGFSEKLGILRELKCEGEFKSDLSGLNENLAKLNTQRDYPGGKL